MDKDKEYINYLFDNNKLALASELTADLLKSHLGQMQSCISLGRPFTAFKIYNGAKEVYALAQMRLSAKHALSMGDCLDKVMERIEMKRRAAHYAIENPSCYSFILQKECEKKGKTGEALKKVNETISGLIGDAARQSMERDSDVRRYDWNVQE